MSAPARTLPVAPDTARAEAPARRGALREVLLLGALYVGYTLARSLADPDLAGARATARGLLGFERHVGADLELGAVQLLLRSDVAAFAASLWYSTAHYVVTLIVVVLLYRRRRDLYVPMRRALVLATGGALVGYLVLPTAPPRLLGAPYVDVLATTADHGWWGAHASAPTALASITNELAAFPSMHAGWALWVALAIWSATRSVRLRVAGAAYAATTAVVVVATANHWVVDVLAGWAVVALATWLTHRMARAHAGRTSQPTPAEPLPVDRSGMAA